MVNLRLYLAQRISAMIMAPLVLGHIAMMIRASTDGLSAAEILGRTQGSPFWALFYGIFVIAVSVHAAIGLRTVAHEYLRPSRGMLNGFAWTVFLALLLLGGRAVYAVVA